MKISEIFDFITFGYWPKKKVDNAIAKKGDNSAIESFREKPSDITPQNDIPPYWNNGDDLSDVEGWRFGDH